MKRTTLLALVTATMMIFAAGCVMEVDHGPGPGVYVADLEVDWHVSGSSDASLCDYYQVGQWSVDVNGPESRGVDLDCHSAWHTGNGLYDLAEGSYSITLSGFDFGGGQFFSRSTTVSLVSNGLVTDVTFALTPADM